MSSFSDINLNVSLISVSLPLIFRGFCCHRINLLALRKSEKRASAVCDEIMNNLGESNENDHRCLRRKTHNAKCIFFRA